jgi:hypothetical protein
MESLLEKNGIDVLEKQTKIIVANRPTKLEFLINEELNEFYKKGINVLDIKYAISDDVGSAVIIYQPLKK